MILYVEDVLYGVLYHATLLAHVALEVDEITESVLIVGFYGCEAGNMCSAILL